MGGGLGENPCWLHLVSLLFLFTLLELVLVVELSYTTCDAYGGDPSLAVGVTLSAVTHLP